MFHLKCENNQIQNSLTKKIMKNTIKVNVCYVKDFFSKKPFL